MSRATYPNAGERVTFLELFKTHSTVEVPIIQRDYAQGRASEVEVRTGFINGLHTALSRAEGDPSLPLDLDFVYGTVEKTNRQAFSPLDGQQRLTTLFLLHWYFAWKDGRGAHFAGLMKNDNKCRFAYAVRASSGEFFDALVSWYPDTTPEHIRTISALITDQSWFFRSWRLDPTIQSVLTMLDSVHETFATSEGFYDRLLNTKQPYITFQLLDLRSFDLSDDLYIKMNARGKPLTSFETFKARLEQHIEKVFSGERRNLYGIPHSLKDYFSHRIDTAWSDLFWSHRDRHTHLFDDRVMHLISALAIVTRDPDSADVDEVLAKLKASASFSFLDYQRHHCLDRPLLDTLITVLDGWCSGSRGELKTYLLDTYCFDERAMFEKVTTNSTELTYEELVQFHAYCAYLVKHRGDPPAEPFGEWMRVIRNLSVNTTYDRVDDYKRSIRSVNKLLDESNRILDYFSDPNVDVRGFNEQQIREEKLKAQLIRMTKDWRSVILKAEQHGYFKGQIEFLFKFAGVLDRWVRNNSSDWSVEDNAEYQQAFTNYFLKASTVFSANGLRDFGEYRWQRALLSIGNYLLPKGRNHCFLTESGRGDTSWKRLLRGAISPDDPVEAKRLCVKDLFDQIDLDIGVKESLISVIDRAKSIDEWRQVIVDRPEMVEFCWNRMIRLESPYSVYLLRRVRMSGEHAELFTYQLKVGLLSDKYEKRELAPFAVLTYKTVNTDLEEPRACLICHSNGESIILEIFNKKGAYGLKLFRRRGELPAELLAGVMRNPSFTAEIDGTVSRTVDRERIEEAIDETVYIVKESKSIPPR